MHKIFRVHIIKFFGDIKMFPRGLLLFYNVLE